MPGITLAAAKAIKIGKLKARVSDYIYETYGLAEQASFNTLMAEGMRRLWVNRQALIQGVHDWVFSVLAEYHAKKDDVNAATDVAAVAAVSLSLASFDATNPRVSVKNAAATRS